MRIPFFRKKVKKKRFTVAFYNVENLFYPEKDTGTLDQDFTPTGKKMWTVKRYHRKVAKLAKTMVAIGTAEHPFPPVLIGVAEIENQNVLKDLLGTHPMRTIPYGYVHFNSPDERGIDTSLIYHKKYFKVVAAEALTLWLENDAGIRDTTRDVLYVKGFLNEETVHVFVNHWPSRRDGGAETDHKRIQAAKLVHEKMEQIKEEEPNPNMIVMGDFNDDPSSKSIELLVAKQGLFNPMQTLHMPNSQGTSMYKGKWHLFDQILVSNSFFNYEKGTHSFHVASIYKHSSLVEKKGAYKGAPYRTFISNRYLGGYSDHLPVYAVFTLNE